MASRGGRRTNLDQLVRQMVVDVLEDHRPRAGHLGSLIDEVRELRRTVNALEKRLEKVSGRRASRGGRVGAGRPGRPPIHTTCTVRGCSRAHYAKGLCSMHYQQWRRTGDWPGPAENDPAKKETKAASKSGKKRTTRRRTTKTKSRR